MDERKLKKKLDRVRLKGESERHRIGFQCSAVRDDLRAICPTRNSIVFLQLIHIVKRNVKL